MPIRSKRAKLAANLIVLPDRILDLPEILKYEPAIIKRSVIICFFYKNDIVFAFRKKDAQYITEAMSKMFSESDQRDPFGSHNNYI
jgi:hypothetical protein